MGSGLDDDLNDRIGEEIPEVQEVLESFPREDLPQDDPNRQFDFASMDKGDMGNLREMVPEDCDFHQFMNLGLMSKVPFYSDGGSNLTDSGNKKGGAGDEKLRKALNALPQRKLFEKMPFHKQRQDGKSFLEFATRYLSAVESEETLRKEFLRKLEPQLVNNRVLSCDPADLLRVDAHTKQIILSLHKFAQNYREKF